MQKKKVRDFEVLLPCFFEQGDQSFSFLTDDHGFKPVHGLVTYQAGRKIITPFKGQDYDVPFFALLRFEKGMNAIEISYGDLDYYLEANIYIDLYERFSLSDLVQASMQDDFGLENIGYLTNQKDLMSSLNILNKALLRNIDLFVNPDPRIVERAKKMRSKRLEQSVKEQHRRYIQIMSEKAAEAFAQKDYKTVIMILRPLGEELYPADRKKLKIAMDQFLGGDT